MADTSIEWTRNEDGSAGKTWNPTTGCDRISPGCRNCYALTMAKRLKLMGQAKYQLDGDPATSGPGFGLAMHPDTLAAPFGWKQPQRVFVNSMSDLFHKDVTDDFIAAVFAVMALTPRHTYQVLTKRPQRMAQLLAERTFWLEVDDQVRCWTGPEGTGYEVVLGGGCHLPNVWLGTSVETDLYTWRANHLRATPAAVRFISAEPLLGPLPSLDLDGIDWLIVGGESGTGPAIAPMHPSWVRDLRDRALARSQIIDVHRTDVPALSGQQPVRVPVAFFFKQWGTWGPDMPDGSFGTVYSLWDREEVDTIRTVVKSDTFGGLDHYIAVYDEHHGWSMQRGKKGRRLLDGRTWDEFPQVSTRVSS